MSACNTRYLYIVIQTANQLNASTIKHITMKKIIFALVISFSSLAMHAENINVNEKVLTAFKTDFVTADQVEWFAGPNYFKAAFRLNDHQVFAFYNQEGKLLGLTRYILTSELPIRLQASLKKSYNQYWVSDLFEAAREEGTSYYITLEDAETKLVLKAGSDNTWTVYEKTKKA